MRDTGGEPSNRIPAQARSVFVIPSIGILARQMTGKLQNQPLPS